MGLTRKRDLAAAVLAAAAVSYLFIRFLYGDFPPITVWTGLSLFAVALAEAVWGVSVRRRIRDGQVGVAHELPVDPAQDLGNRARVFLVEILVRQSG